MPRGSPQPKQCGGNRRSNSPVFISSLITLNDSAMSDQRPPLFDVRAAQAARLRARRIGGERFLEDAALEGLADRLSPVARRFAHGLWIGDTVPAAIRPFAENWSLADFDGNEILAATEDRFDLALSLYTLQSINDLPGALIQIRRVLKPDGLFLAALFGGDTLRELRDCFAFGRKREPGRHQPTHRPLRRCARSGQPVAAGGFRACPSPTAKGLACAIPA